MKTHDNKFYSTLGFVILPAALITACSTSGVQNKIPKSPELIAVEQVENSEKNKSIELLDNNTHSRTIDSASITPMTDISVTDIPVTDIPESKKYPLTQATYSESITAPVKRIYQFGFNKQEMSHAEQRSLEQHAEYLLANPDSLLIINGHSDTQGNREYNKFLSKERANKVAQFLIHYGVKKSQIQTHGMGDSQPLNDVDNFKENRRVELEYNDSRVATK